MVNRIAAIWASYSHPNTRPHSAKFLYAVNVWSRFSKPYYFDAVNPSSTAHSASASLTFMVIFRYS